MPLAYLGVGPAPGVGIEPSSPRSERGVATNQLPRSKFPFLGHAISRQVRGEGIEPSFAISKTAVLPLDDPPRVSCGNRTRLNGLEDRCLTTRPRTQKAEGVGLEPTRPACAGSTVFETAAVVQSILGLPSQSAPGVGIEPTTFRLTAGGSTD
jgi:hypothetical protein